MIVTNGLVGYWNSKKGVNGTVWENIAPATKGQYNGTLNGSTVTPEGILFDGVDDSADLPVPSEVNKITNFSFEFRLIPTVVRVEDDIIANEKGLFFIYFWQNNSIAFDPHGDNPPYYNIPNRFAANNEYYITITYNSSNGNLGVYINGSSISISNVNGSVTNVFDFKFLQLAKSYYGSYYRGVIDGIRIYDRLLTQQEVQQNYQVRTDVGLDEPKEPTEHIGASNLKGIASLTANGINIKDISANLQGQGFLSASHITIKNTQANLLGVGKLSASSKDISVITGSADLTGQGILQPDGQKETHSESSLFGRGSLEVDAERHALSSVRMMGQGKFAVSTSDVSIVTASAGLTGIGIVSVNGRKEASSSIHMLGQGLFNVNVSDVTIITASADLKGAGHIVAEGLRIANAHVKLSGKGTLDAEGNRIAQSTSNMTASGLISAIGHRIIIVDAELIGKGLLSIKDGEPAIGTIQLKGKRELYVYLRAKQSLYVDLKGKQQLGIHLIAKHDVFVNLKAKSDLIVRLRGDIMTAENQNFSMYAGDTKYIKFPIDGIESLTGSTIKWGIWENKHSDKNIFLKDAAVVDDQAQIKLDPADTAELNGTYYHECELTDSLGNISTVLTGRVTINKSGVLG